MGPDANGEEGIGVLGRLTLAQPKLFGTPSPSPLLPAEHRGECTATFQTY